MGNFSSKCGNPTSEEYRTVGTAYPYLYWGAVGAAGFTLLLSVYVNASHFHRWRKPEEQRQILRLKMAPAVFALVSMGQIMDYSLAQRIQPISDLYLAVYACSLFLLFCQYGAPDTTFGDAQFDLLRAADESDKPIRVDWPRLTWLAVFQYPITQIIATVVAEVTAAYGRYCPNTLYPTYGNFWVFIIELFNQGAALSTIIKFASHIPKRMKTHRGLQKLAAFNALLFVQWVQSTIYGFIPIHPSQTFSRTDLLYGIPAILISIESILFMVWFSWLCNSGEYSSKAMSFVRPAPAYLAIFDAVNPSDLVLGMFRIFGVAKDLHHSGGFKTYMEVRAQKKNTENAARTQDQTMGSRGYNRALGADGNDGDRRRGPLGMALSLAQAQMNKRAHPRNEAEHESLVDDMELLPQFGKNLNAHMADAN